MIDGRPACVTLPDTDDAEKWAELNETLHLAPTAGTMTNSNGTVYRWYRVLRGSSDFDTAEMSHLLGLLIAECKEQGIDTATPDEIKRMEKLYAEHYSARQR